MYIQTSVQYLLTLILQLPEKGFVYFFAIQYLIKMSVGLLYSNCSVYIYIYISENIP